MYVILETGGKQYPVKEGEVFTVEKIPAEVGQEVVLDKILFASKDEGDVLVGEPYLNGKVVCEVVEQGRHRKVVVFKFKKRKDYKKKQGHRQYFTKLKVKSIEV
jgi:large subunit ribosomal protein L21